MKEGARPGRRRRLDAEAEGMLATWMAAGPRAYGHEAELWTVPLLCRQLACWGYECSEHTLRRALHRMGWRWRGSGYVLAGGRIKPTASEGAAAARDGRLMANGLARSSALRESAVNGAAAAPDMPAQALGVDVVPG